MGSGDPMLYNKVRLAALAGCAMSVLVIAGCGAREPVEAPPATNSAGYGAAETPELMGAPPAAEATPADGLLGGPAPPRRPPTRRRRSSPPTRTWKTWRRPTAPWSPPWRRSPIPRPPAMRPRAVSAPARRAARAAPAPVAKPAARPVVAAAPAPAEAGRRGQARRRAGQGPGDRRRAAAAAKAALCQAADQAGEAASRRRAGSHQGRHPGHGRKPEAGQGGPGHPVAARHARRPDQDAKPPSWAWARPPRRPAPTPTCRARATRSPRTVARPPWSRTASPPPSPWQVKPTTAAKGPLKTDFGVELNGAKPVQGFTLGSIAKQVAPIQDAVKEKTKGFKFAMPALPSLGRYEDRRPSGRRQGSRARPAGRQPWCCWPC